jgi:hypothetical protein
MRHSSTGAGRQSQAVRVHTRVLDAGQPHTCCQPPREQLPTCPYTMLGTPKLSLSQFCAEYVFVLGA